MSYSMNSINLLKTLCNDICSKFDCFYEQYAGKSLHKFKGPFKAHENNANGLPIYNNKTITVQGVVTVPTGVWHDTANYFSIVTEDDSYRFAGGIAVYLSGDTSPHVNIGDKVVVTGTLTNSGYSTDTGTTVIKPSSSSDITIIGSNYKLPEAYPIYTDASYNDSEVDLGHRFEGMPVRVMGRVFNYDNDGIVIDLM